MASPTMDHHAWLRKQLEEADSDLVRAMLKEFTEQLMAAEVDVECNATYGERTPDRANSRNGYRPRRWDTRTGTVELQILKLRSGSFSRTGSWSHGGTRKRRSSRSSPTAISLGCQPAGSISSWGQLGIEGISKSQARP